jgi:hypothetical protein
MRILEQHIKKLLGIFGTEALRREWESIQARGESREIVLFSSRLEDLKRDEQEKIRRDAKGRC